MRFPNVRTAPGLVALATLLLSACGGSDATAPSSIDSASALQSLALGLNQIGGAETPVAAETNETFAALAPVLDKVTMTVNGATQVMYALGLRESFPAGTCEEAIFVDPQFPAEPGVCTPPSFGVEMILWQTQSATQVPNRLMIVATDVGTVNLSSSSSVPDAFAIYVESPDKVFLADAGTLTTQVSASNQSCSITLPPYAKSGTCSFATFTAQGSMQLSAPATGNGPGIFNYTDIGIPSISMDGLWVNVTEVQPVPVTAIRASALRAISSVLSRSTAHYKLPAIR